MSEQPDHTLSQGEPEPEAPLGPMVDGQPVDPDLPLDSGPALDAQPEPEEGES